MAIVKAIKSGASIKRVIDYVTRKDGLDNFLMEGIDCNPHTASYEMLYTRDKFSKHEGVQYIHMVYSLSPDESERVGMEQLIVNARRLVEGTKNFRNHQVIICAHDDKKHKHAHIVVNAVNLKTGKKIRWYRTDLRNFKERLVEMSKEQGLEIPVKGQGKSLGGSDVKLYKSIERGFHDQYQSWMLDMYKKVYQAKNLAVSKEDFIQRLESEEIKTRWDNRKTIMFEDEEGHKVRSARFEEVFKIDLSKEALENEFRSTAQLLDAEQGHEENNPRESEASERERDFEDEDYELFITNARDEISRARAVEQASETERNNQIFERTYREACRERLNLEREREAERRNRRSKKRSRDDGYSL